MNKKFNLADEQREMVKKGEFIEKSTTDTFSELKFGKELLNSNIKIIPQYKLGDYCFDFKILDYPILIEIDGGVHKELRRRRKDYIKDRYALNLGYKFLRFGNYEIHKNCGHVRAEVQQIIKSVGKQPTIIKIHRMTIKEQIVEWWTKIFKRDDDAETGKT